MRKFALLPLLALTLSAVPAHADDTLNLVDKLPGTVVTVSGKPFPNAVVYLQNLLATSSAYPGPMPPTPVVTDSAGHFTWNVPKGAYVYDNPVNPVTDCGALPADTLHWQADLCLSPTPSSSGPAQDVVNPIVRQCSAKWVQTGKNPSLLIVVPDPGTVSIQLFGPNCQVLGDQVVKVTLPNESSDFEGAVVYTGKTDQSGWIHLRWFPGLQDLQIIAPGIGFGATGSYELVSGQNLTVKVPPLAPFATISGTVAPGVVKSGASVVGMSLGGVRLSRSLYLERLCVSRCRHRTTSPAASQSLECR